MQKMQKRTKNAEKLLQYLKTNLCFGGVCHPVICIRKVLSAALALCDSSDQPEIWDPASRAQSSPVNSIFRGMKNHVFFAFNIKCLGTCAVPSMAGRKGNQTFKFRTFAISNIRFMSIF